VNNYFCQLLSVHGTDLAELQIPVLAFEIEMAIEDLNGYKSSNINEVRNVKSRRENITFWDPKISELYLEQRIIFTEVLGIFNLPTYKRTKNLSIVLMKEYHFY
jgi:hypothetical protein